MNRGKYCGRFVLMEMLLKISISITFITIVTLTNIFARSAPDLVHHTIYR